MVVTVTDASGRIRIEYNGNVTNMKKQKVTVKAKGDNVIIYDNENPNEVEYPYTYFSSPSGNSAQEVADAIAAFLADTTGTEIYGTGTTNYIAKFTAAQTIADSLMYDNGVSVAIGTTSPSAKALFEVASTTQGVLLPRMTTTQRNAITSPALSLLIFNTSTNLFNYWDGSGWLEIDSTSGGDISGGGNAGYLPKFSAATNIVNSILYESSGKLGVNTTNPTMDLTFGGATGITIGVEQSQFANTAGNWLLLQSGNAATGATNKDGGTLYLQSGVSTGTGTSNIVFATSPAGSSGTSDNALAIRMRIIGSGYIGVGTDTPQALMDFTSTTTGVLLPRLTTAQRNAIPATVPTGLLLYNTTLNTLDYYNGSGWVSGMVGTGTANYVSKFTAANTLAVSLLFDNGTTVSIGNATPNAKAIFELASTTQGMLPPRMTTAQRDAITATVPTGLLLYNTTLNTLDYYNGSGWVSGMVGTGTANYVSKFTAANTLAVSLLFDNGTTVSIGNATPSAKAIFELASTTQGTLLSRMTTAQRNAITSVPTGLLLYNSTTNTFDYYNGSAWVSINLVDSKNFAWDGQGGIVTTGNTRYLIFPFSCTISGWNINATGTSPTCTIDIWKIASGTALPTVANTIMGTKPALSTGNAVRSSTLTGWTTTAIAAGDIVGINLDAVANATTINFGLEFFKS